MRSNKDGKKRALFFASLLFSMLLMLDFLFESILKKDCWLAALVICLPHEPLIIPALILLIWSLICRSVRNLALNLISLIFILFIFCSFNIPLPRKKIEGSPITIVSYNILGGAFGNDAIRHTLERSDPDIICLQEVNRWNLEDSLFPGEKDQWNVAHSGELAVISRFPILGFREHDLAPTDSDKGALEVSIDIDGKPITVINTHLTLIYHGLAIFRDHHLIKNHLLTTMHTRRLETDGMISLCEKIKTPVVLAGDLNAPPREIELTRLSARCRDAFGSSGWGFGHTYAADFPIVRIDYIKSTMDFAAIECKALSTAGNDHLALAARLILIK